MNAGELALFLGVALGALVILVVGWVYFKKQVFDKRGATLSVVGMILLGFPFWRSITFSAYGFELKLDAAIQNQAILMETVEGLIDVQQSESPVPLLRRFSAEPEAPPEWLREAERIQLERTQRLDELRGRLREMKIPDIRR